MIDIHSHILPGLDDGAKTRDIAIQMCLAAADDGVTQIIATPHANSEFAYSRERNRELAASLQTEVGEGIKIGVGCDFHVSAENLDLLRERPRDFVIEDTDYLLVELSDFMFPPAMHEALFRIASGGLVPVITHPERNAVLRTQPQRILEFAANGFAIQVTANSFTGFWGKDSLRLAEFLLKKHAVHVVASDCHDLQRRPPVLSAAYERVRSLAGDDVADSLFLHNPSAIVNNASLPYLPKPVL